MILFGPPDESELVYDGRTYLAYNPDTRRWDTPVPANDVPLKRRARSMDLPERKRRFPPRPTKKQRMRQRREEKRQRMRQRRNEKWERKGYTR